MADYICPNCRGGFERPVYDGDDGFCPWCHQELNGSYEPPTVHSVSKVKDNAEDGTTFLDLFR